MSKSQYKMRRAEAFFDLVYPVFFAYFNGFYSITEFCAGNGNAGRLFAGQRDVRAVDFVDIKQVRDLGETLRIVGNKGRVFLNGIDNYDIPVNSGVIAIHACGSLTDKILRKAVAARTPVAVMTCCHSIYNEKYKLRDPPSPLLLDYAKREDYFEEVRRQFLIEHEHDATILRVDSKISPSNNIILGIPRNSYC